MKKQLLILSLLLSTTTFSSLSFGEWELIEGNENVYWDPENIRDDNGSVYFWILVDFGELEVWDDSQSRTVYIELDCASLGFKELTFAKYKTHMAAGSPFETRTPPNQNMKYETPDTPMYSFNAKVCDYVGSN